MGGTRYLVRALASGKARLIVRRAAVAGSSVRRVSRADTFRAQPVDHVLLPSRKAGRSIQRRSFRVVRNPLGIGTCTQQALRGATLAPRAGMPERLRELLLVDSRPQEILQWLQRAEGGSMPELVHAGASGYQQASHMPAAVADRVVERRPDRPVRRLEIRAPLDERQRDIDVVAARCPVKRGLAVFVVVSPSIRIRSGSDQQRDDGGPVRDYPGQSLTMWSGVRPPATASRDPASAGSASSSPANAATSPSRMAAIAASPTLSSITAPSVLTRTRPQRRRALPGRPSRGL